MPSRQLLINFGIALVLVGVVAGVVLYINRGAHLVIEGTIQKVRTLALDDNSSAAFLDFRFTNPANYPFVVQEVTLILVQMNGDPIEGMTIPEMDAKRIFDYYKLLGPKYNSSLLAREKVAPKQSLDRMISAQFPMPEGLLQQRRNLIIRVRELDGLVSEIAERK